MIYLWQEFDSHCFRHIDSCIIKNWQHGDGYLNSGQHSNWGQSRLHWEIVSKIRVSIKLLYFIIDEYNDILKIGIINLNEITSISLTFIITVLHAEKG